MYTNTINNGFNVTGGLQTSNNTTSTPPSEIDQEGFMRLLVAQLQNQDPLNPMNNEEFVQQLTSFSSLDELRSINKNMDGLGQLGNIAELLSTGIAFQQSSMNAQSVSLIGKNAEVYSDVVAVGSEVETEIGISLPTDPPVSEINVALQSADGVVLYQTRIDPANPPEGARIEGNRLYLPVPQENLNGQPMPDTAAQIVVTASTEMGDVNLDTTIRGLVNGIDFRSEEPMITVGNTVVGMFSVLAVNNA